METDKEAEKLKKLDSVGSKLKSKKRLYEYMTMRRKFFFFC